MSRGAGTLNIPKAHTWVTRRTSERAISYRPQ